MPAVAHLSTNLPGELPRRVARGITWEVELLPSGDLGNSSFILVEKEKKAAVVIDPTRDVARYLARIAERGLKLAWVLDTHLHNDFVSGGRELSRAGGGRLALSAEAGAEGIDRPLRDGEELDFGSVSVRALASPGHTPEHMSYAVCEGTGEPRVLFSGGSLMAGTAARADLLGPRFTYTLAREEFTTLHERFASLAGNVAVLPTHAGGSFCGSGAVTTPITRMGVERRSNPLVRARDMGSFLQAYLHDTPFPAYYAKLRRLNQAGAPPVGLPVPELAPLSPADLDVAMGQAGVTAIDTRKPTSYAHGHVPGSLNIDPQGTFSAWVGWLRDSNESFILIDEDPAVRRVMQIGLLRIGFDGLRGFLQGGVAAYEASGRRLTKTRRGTMADVRAVMVRGDPFTLLDVRHTYEAAKGALPGAVNIPLPNLNATTTAMLPHELPVYVHCQSGYRAGIAASVLEGFGFRQVVHVTEGPSSWRSSSRSASHRPGRKA